MAEDVKPSPFKLEAAMPLELAAPVSRSERARQGAYRNRFLVVYFLLAVVLGCAVGALAVSLTSSSSKHVKTQARPFVPRASGEVGAIALAAQVQRAYRLENGQALVDVIATRNTLQNGNLGYLRVAYQIIQPDDASRSRDTQILQTSDAIQFSLCGSGASCTIPGTPTAQRLALLRREGLELGVRTLDNDPNVDNVVVFLSPVPPPQGSTMEGYALMFSRQLIDHNDPTLLTRPITQIVRDPGTMIQPGQITANDALRIRELTKPYLYLYRFQVVGGHDAVLDLQPVQS